MKGFDIIIGRHQSAEILTTPQQLSENREFEAGAS